MDLEGSTTPQSTPSITPSNTSKKSPTSSSNLRQSSITESFIPVAIQSTPSTVNDSSHDNNPCIVEPKIATRPKTSIPHTSILETTVPSNSSIVNNDSPPAEITQSVEPPAVVVVASKKTKSTPHDRKSKKTMFEWVQEALLAMKDRTGSSHHAIFKYILTEGASVFMDTPTIRSRFNQTLKQAVARGQLVKIKASYKISLEWIKKENMKRASTATRRYMEQRRLDELRKNGIEDHMLQSDTTTQQQPGKLEETKKMQQMKRLEQQRIKEEKERLEKERLERIKRRRFPIEDTRLHQEDKEFGIPSTLPRAPPIPFFFQLTRDSKSTAMTPSRCDFTDMESRGIVPDLIQIFHFFQGNVGFAALMKPKIVCDFTFRHLLYAVDEILMGNARKSKLVPPLLQHLMLCCLTVLTNPTTEGETLAQKQLNKDLLELKEALGPASWPEVCCMYMDCTDRYYKTSASQDSSVLPPGVTDVHYLFRVTNSPDLNHITTTHDTIPEGYYGYLGHPQSSLAKAYEKLTRQDAWLLNAEELLALLRALTDDILATNPLLATEISNRDQKVASLMREKRAADTNHRKLQATLLEFTTKEAEEEETKKSETKKGGHSKNKETNGANERRLKLISMKKSLEQAQLEKEKANELYDKGVKSLVARSEPFGMDRHYNRFYCLEQEPEIIAIEMNRFATARTEKLPPEVCIYRTSWHAIAKKSLLERYASSLDVRGHREKALYEALMGTGSVPPNRALIHRMESDCEELPEVKALRAERRVTEEKLEKLRLDIAKIGQEEGRRASRFILDLEGELESKITLLDSKLESLVVPFENDYFELTGMATLQKFDARERRNQAYNDILYPVLCADLIPDGKKFSGLVGSIVQDILAVESMCQDLVPWEDETKRTCWISDFELLANSWNDSLNYVLGPQTTCNDEDVSVASGEKRRRSSVSERLSIDSSGKRRSIENSGSYVSSNHITSKDAVTKMKSPLLALEERVYQVSGLAMADRDQEIADENMSTADEIEEKEEYEQPLRSKYLLEWKRKAHFVRVSPSSKGAEIKKALLLALDAARKAHLGDIVAKLRSALLLLQSRSLVKCKQVVSSTLEENGGYDPKDNEDNDERIQEEKQDYGAEESEFAIPTNLCYEAVSLLGSLGDDDKASRNDWIDAVRSCKSLARFAALSTAFCRKATAILEKLMSERNELETALQTWNGDDRRKSRSNNRSNSKEQVELTTEMWADVEYTDTFCMVRLPEHPWWPAKKCVAKDAQLQKSLKEFDRVLVSMLGEHGELRCVRGEHIRSFTGKPIDKDLKSYSNEDRLQLAECLATARRIIRGRKMKAKDDQSYIEEKKTGF